MDINVSTFIRNDDLFLSTCKKINKFLTIEDLSCKRKENYAYYQMSTSDSIAVSVYHQDTNILGFSTVIHRDMFGNGCRILNRFYKSNNYRFVTKDILLTKKMILDQVDICRKLNFDYVFMSRESNTGATPFKFYLNKLKLDKWIIETDKFNVCNGDNSCQQYITWLPISEHYKKIELKRIKNDCREK